MAILTGTAANDTLAGTANDDTLNGLSGADKMSGGDGNDRYFIDQAGDIVTELANKGTEDYVVATFSTTLAANVEFLELAGGALNGTGNASRNFLIGNIFDNVLSGADANDQMIGHGGDDTLIGGKGDDHLTATVGQDLLQGGAGDDIMVGDEDGDDAMQGGAGNDAYLLGAAGDTIMELPGQGIDGIVSELLVRPLVGGANVENLVLSGKDTVGIGNGLDNRFIDRQLRSHAGWRRRQRHAGRRKRQRHPDRRRRQRPPGRRLRQRCAAGGLGNDLYVTFGFGTDTITELANEGIDEIRSFADINLSVANLLNIENVDLERRPRFRCHRQRTRQRHQGKRFRQPPGW